MKRAIVIGAGFGGIAAALRLRAKGYAVKIVDKCPRLGGRAQVFERGGYRFDAGPTVITAPFLFDELFQLFDCRREDYVDFKPLGPWYQFYFADGTRFNYGGSVDETLAEISKFNTQDQQGYKQLVRRSEAIFDVGFTKLSATPFHSFWTMIKQLPALIRLRSDRTVWQLVAKHIKDARLRQAFSVQPLLVGGNPFDTTSIYGLIHFLERKWGIHFAMGGTGALVDALEKLMREQGIEIELNTEVSRLEVEDGKITRAELANGESITGDLFISNADPAYLYRHMIDKKDQSLSARFKAQRAKLSMGLFVLFFGTTKQYSDVEHHTIWLGQRYKELLRDIFKGQELPEDFSLYLHRPTATDPSFAPAGHDSFYVLAPVPNLNAEIDWSKSGPQLQDKIIKALEETMMPGLSETIVEDFYMTPENFKDDYLSVGGAGFSVAPIFSQSAWFRFHNKAEGPENLYLVGAGTHPGAGMPGVLCSAKVLDNLIPEASAAEVNDFTTQPTNTSLASG
ncbi:MAG: phytoene desaturase family protein [Pseudomonadota bacterium]